MRPNALLGLLARKGGLGAVVSKLAQARALLAEAAELRQAAALVPGPDCVEAIVAAKRMEQDAFELVRENWRELPSE